MSRRREKRMMKRMKTRIMKWNDEAEEEKV